MTPYGYHNSEMARVTGDERRNAREAIRQAKLVRQQASEEAGGSELEARPVHPGAWHRLLARIQASTPRTALHNLRTHSQ